MNRLVIVFALTGLVGCVSAPQSRDPAVLLADTSSADVIRFEGVVDVPFETAYRNVLRQARICWSRASVTGFLGANWTVDHDVDPRMKAGSIYVSDKGVGQGIVFTSVNLVAVGERTRIKGAAINPKAGTLPGAPEMPLLPQWAAGESTPCATPNFLL